MGPGSVWFERRLWSSYVGAAIVASWIGLNMSWVILMVGRTTSEDDALRQDFDQQWQAWAAKTDTSRVLRKYVRCVCIVIRSLRTDIGISSFCTKIYEGYGIFHLSRCHGC